MATTPVDVTVKQSQLKELKWALEILDNPNSVEDGKPKKYKFKQAAVTRYDLAMDYREVFEAHRPGDKVRMDLVRAAMDEQSKVHPESKELIGTWQRDAAKEIEELMDQTVTLKIRPIPVESLDLENNDIPFTAIGVLIGTIISNGDAK